MIRDATLVVIQQDVVILEVQVTLPEVVTHKVTHKDVGSQVTHKDVGSQVTHKDVGSRERHSHWYLPFREEGVGDNCGYIKHPIFNNVNTMVPKWTYMAYMSVQLTTLSMAQMCLTPGVPCDTTVQTLPNQCPMYSSTLGTGATSIDDCRCSPGAYKNATTNASSGCTLCLPGTFMNATGGTACIACPVSFYMDMPGSSFCWECFMGALVKTTGATNNSICVPPLWTVRLVIPYQNWTTAEMKIAIKLIADGLGISNPRVSILSVSRRRGLLSSMMTLEVGCSSQADADAIAEKLTPDFMRNVFADSTISAPLGIISVVVMGITSTTSPPPPIVTTTPQPTANQPLVTTTSSSSPSSPSPLSSPLVVPVGVSLGVTVVSIGVLLLYYSFKSKKTKVSPTYQKVSQKAEETYRKKDPYQQAEIKVKIPKYLLNLA